MAKEKAFNDFFLLGLRHLKTGEIFEKGKINSSAKAVIRQRIEHGKKAIRAQTVRGDLIAFESPKRWTFEQYKKISRTLHKVVGVPLPDAVLRQWWDGLVKEYFGFYAELADYAKSIGRKTISLETSIRKPESKVRELSAKARPGSQTFERVAFLITSGANPSFLKKVLRKKPKMVVVSDGHAAFLESMLKPKKVDYFPKVSQRQKEEYLRYMNEQSLKFRRKKRQRLSRNRELARRKRPRRRG